MATAPAKGKGNILTRKIGPLPLWVYPLIGGAGFLIYRYVEDRNAAAATTASTAAESAGTGSDTGTDADTSSTGTIPTFASLAAWEQAAVAAMANGKLTPAEGLNGLTDWINGQCVDAEQYAGIGSIIETIGLPPGFSTVPVLSVCATKSAGGTKTKTAGQPVQKFVGSGFGIGTGKTARGKGNQAYTQLTEQELTSYKGPTFYELKPGDFVPYVKGKSDLKKGTPIYGAF
jgi:hypothetical protein